MDIPHPDTQIIPTRKHFSYIGQFVRRRFFLPICVCNAEPKQLPTGAQLSLVTFRYQ